MLSTPADWMPVLTKRLDTRRPRVDLLRSYANGHAPMPEMGANTRAAWIEFQKKATTNYGGLAVEALANRIVPNGITIGSDPESEAVLTARRIWRDNYLDIAIAEAVRDYLTCSVGYLVVGQDQDGPRITREAPEQFYAAPDPLHRWKARAAIKVWRDLDAGEDYAYVWTEGQGQLFSRSSRYESGLLIAKSSGDWIVLGEPDVYDGRPPVVIMERLGGVGFFEPHTDVIDRINLGKLNRLVISAMQAFRQRALRAADGMALPDKDPDGNDIDYKTMFEPAPGALWELPEGIDVWESQSADIRPLLDGEKNDLRDFAAVLQLPIAALIPSGENQSAEGAANAKEGLYFQARNEIARLRIGVQVALVLALGVAGVDLADQTLSVEFAPPDRTSMSERYAAAAAAAAAGQSRKSIMRDILGMSPDQIAQEEADRADEQLSNLVFAQQATSASANP